ncbi:amino acid adenylation domain-containing protein [Saccharopolyspora antimicrobica]|uniref:Amino acid adenylation domain-containing protein n=1 Tax=Saccharopolyspora antimicrobica TaxID=455193 RepID=A0A1I5FL31_9PSEU|nr:non-ribosomal peptide synthetase [Saccharopolyspora antimicrobica]RKT82209.1 amino acid adenylation domain-containing protein [Saccharopolyspora antimicrobica]SFO24333.1 amino acid adenylation domain-containing protein [Saccharopolyspora antimicrobica]
MTATVVPVEGRDEQDPAAAPLTESQLGLLVVHRSVPAAHLYNVVAEIGLDPGFDGVRIRSALADVLAVQPALRSALRESPRPHAHVAEPVPANRVPVSLAQASAAEFDAEKHALLTELANTAFDLGDPPLLRAAHLRAADGSRAVLLLAVHHTVFDGFSLRPLVDDLSKALTGTLDVAALQKKRERALRRELQAQVAAADTAEAEAAVEAIAELLRQTSPTVLHPRPNRPTSTDFSGDRVELRLTAEENRLIDQACGALGISAFTFFSAIYAAVLARHSGQDSVVFGAPLMARRTVGSFDLCGFFVNTLPLVVDVPWQVSFEAYLRDHVAPRVQEVKSNAAVPFTRIVRRVDPSRGGNRNPLFSCMLAMQDSTDVAPDSPVRELREHGTGTAKFDLWLGVTPTGDGWLLELEHDRTLLPPEIVDGIAGSLRSALRAVAADTDVRLSDLFTDASTVETERADGLGVQPAAPDLDGWLRKACAARPDAIAVDEHDRQVSYAELDASAGALAVRLQQCGVRAGDVVGLATGSLLDTIVAILAVLRLRAAYLPLDSSLPDERLAYMLDKAECRVAVADAPVPGVRVVAPGGAGPAELAEQPGTDADAVYVMFTSGSTGKPKGVLMHHAPLVNLTAWQVDALGMDSTTRFLQYAPGGFDVSFQEIVPTLVAGGTVVARDDVDRRDFPALVRHVRDKAVTHVYLPVAALAPFVQAVEAAGERLPSVRWLCVSGEQLVMTAQIRRFFAQRPGIDLVNLYGPTETHAVTTFSPTAADHWDAHVPIGRPITGVTAQVVDRTGHLAPRGVLGELLLGGRCPAHGYVNDPQRTDERFLPDPRRPAGRRYRTGDQVMWAADGQLVFLGRNDDQVKIRGFRVELGEIEAAAQELPGVRLAVAAVDGDAAARRLLLFLTTQPDSAPEPAEVRRELAARLPGYMVPAVVVAVERIPTTANGKVDRNALVAAAADLLAEDDRAAALAATLSADPVEAWLQWMWAGLLGDTLPPVDGSLLELGAHSLNALIALARIEEEFAVSLTILDFFADPTVAAMAAALRAEGVKR